ncbi:FAD-dependent oxidoreductase, partial [Candidatus Peregrinibacteria bacterium]|nr:FAD-dependent oxidoreductase [Candidatus Peregrinibacteria bacterium]
MKTNFLIIGSGISGLNFALQAAKKGQVLIVTKKKIVDSSTNFAQGGIAAVLDTADNFEKHVTDTLKAGSYHNNKRAVKFMVKRSAAAIYRLIDLGVEFENSKGELKLTKEGGHGHRRIAYVGDYTGQEIEKILVKRVKEHPNIKIFENSFALDLIVKNKTCFGAQIIQKNQIKTIFADQTILATGGIGQLFKYTTNPPIATADGIAMGIRAGCQIKDIEFIQFHPTALAKNASPM